MSMEEVKDFMRKVGWGILATTDGAKVGIRPMGGWAWIGNELWCASGASSEKVAHLRRVPYASYCFANQEGKHVRIAGPCTVSTDAGDKRKLYGANPTLKNHIRDPASPEYVVIRLRPESVRFMKSMDMAYWEIQPD
jgi:general stress protein 26